MGCFIIPAAEAVVATIAYQVIKSKEKSAMPFKKDVGLAVTTDKRLPFSHKLKWLTNMLWGGSFLLAFEHVWHGEVIPWFPFLTAMNNPADMAEMLHEMATAGTLMSVLVTAVWACMVLITSKVEKRPTKKPTLPSI